MIPTNQKPNVTENNIGLITLENSGQIFTDKNTTYNPDKQVNTELVFDKTPTVCPCGQHKRFSKLTSHSEGGKCWSCDKFFPPIKFNGSPKITNRVAESTNPSKAQTKSILTLERIHTYWTNDGNNYLMQVRVFRDSEGKKSCFQYRWEGVIVWEADGQFREVGGWVKGLSAVKMTLYNSPLLIMMQQCSEEYIDSTIVYIVEGEKDCETLKKYGYIATCNPLGAGKWCNEYSELLRGLTCVVLPDNDDVGLKHGQQVVQSLLGVSKCAILLPLTELMPNLPQKADVTDYMELGGVL